MGPKTFNIILTIDMWSQFLQAHDDGTVQVLLCLYGTIPIKFRSTPYNIPVAFWVPTDYPMAPPIAFVVPTSSMLVRKSQHVDVSGRCAHPYLEHWNSQPHNEVWLSYFIFNQFYHILVFADIYTYIFFPDLCKC